VPSRTRQAAEDITGDDPPPDSGLAEVQDEREEVCKDHDEDKVPDELDGKSKDTFPVPSKTPADIMPGEMKGKVKHIVIRNAVIPLERCALPAE
jgi:hypothetical protein